MIKHNIQCDSQPRKMEEKGQTDSVLTEFDFGAGHITYMIRDPQVVLDQPSSSNSADETHPSPAEEILTDNQESAQLINVPTRRYPLGKWLFYFVVAFLLLMLLH
ncbi:hypothetical protein C6497_13865 [Candidatus Poribacteria bacterium]|nr:MAG: hypothetical protein C6497_13865 [Candidatus Poribacteria bacterium]